MHSGTQTASDVQVHCLAKLARRFLSHHQQPILRQAYMNGPYPGSDVYDNLSSNLGISKRKVQAWYASKCFQLGVKKINGWCRICKLRYDDYLEGQRPSFPYDESSLEIYFSFASLASQKY